MEVEITVPPKHVPWFVLNRTFPVVVSFYPSGDLAALGDKQFMLYKAPEEGLHVRRKGGPILGTVNKNGVVGAITEDAAKDLRAIRAAYYNVGFDYEVAYMFKGAAGRQKVFTHPRCKDAFAARSPTFVGRPQYAVKGTPTCAVCGKAVE